MANPAPTGEWRTPGHLAVWSGEAGTIAFYDKYSDPDGEDGWLEFLVRWMPSGTPVLGSPVAGSQTVSGGQSTWFVGNSLFGGEFHWKHLARDVSGEASGYFGDFALFVNNPPGAPALGSPQAGAAVPTPQPVLSLTGANPDPDGDWVAWDYKVTTGAGCTGTVAASSGWLPMGATTWTPPLGALKDGQDYYWCARSTDFVGRHYGSANGPWSSARLLKIRLPKRGTQSYWPMFSRGPLSVNEATGNLFLAVPGPSFSSVAGAIGGGFSYNLFDTNASVFNAASGSAWTAGITGAPAKLVDHNLLSGDASSTRSSGWRRTALVPTTPTLRAATLTRLAPATPRSWPRPRRGSS